MIIVGGRKRVAVVILIAIVSTAVAAWVVSRRPPRQVLTEEEVRQLILEYPGGIHFEVKPETIEFLSLELVPIEESPLPLNRTIIYEDGNKTERSLPDKIWVVEYECDGRTYFPLLWKITSNPTPPFTRKFVHVVIDAYTGEELCAHAEDV